MYNMQHSKRSVKSVGDHLREVRERRQQEDARFSLRQVAERVGIEPGYLSRIERGEVAPPSDAVLERLARELGEDVDLVFAMAGRVSSELQQIILKRPKVFAELLRHLKGAPDHAILKVVREVRDGKW